MKKWHLFACVPYAFAIIIFYSVAVHMYYTLEGWPTSIGTRGFPESLLIHANIQGWYLSILGFFHCFCFSSDYSNLLYCAKITALNYLFFTTDYWSNDFPCADVFCS